MNVRNIVIAGTLALAGALSSGTANAAPATDLSLPIATDNAIEQAYYPGGYYGRRLCRMPFFRLVRIFGYWQAKRIKRRCYYRPYYGY